MAQLIKKITVLLAAELIIREDLEALIHHQYDVRHIRRYLPRRLNERWLNIRVVDRADPSVSMECRIRITDSLIRLSELNYCRLDYTAVDLSNQDCFQFIKNKLIELLERGDPIAYLRTSIVSRLRQANLDGYCSVRPLEYTSDREIICRFKRRTFNAFDIDQIRITFGDDCLSAHHHRTFRRGQPDDFTKGGVDKVLEDVWRWVEDDIRVNRG
jgi:hypothetical protein